MGVWSCQNINFILKDILQQTCLMIIHQSVLFVPDRADLFEKGSIFRVCFGIGLQIQAFLYLLFPFFPLKFNSF